MAPSDEYFDVYVLFVGLIGWVPRTGKDLLGRRREVGATALLPKVIRDDASYGYKTADGASMETHYPKVTLLLGSSSDWPGQPNASDFPEETRTFFSNHGIQPRPWSLDRNMVHLHFNGAPSNPYERRHGHKASGNKWPDPENADEVVDFDWVPPIGKILPSAQVVDPTCLRKTGAVHHRVAARIELTAGELCSAGMVKVAGKMPAYEFLPLSKHSGTEENSPLVQSLSEYVLWRTRVFCSEGCQGTVAIKSFDGGEDRYLIDPVAFGDDFRGIFLMVGNLPHLGAASSLNFDEPARHFELFYELSETPPPRDNRPVPQLTSDTPRQGGRLVLPELGRDLAQVFDAERVTVTGAVGRPICPQAQFSSSS